MSVYESTILIKLFSPLQSVKAILKELAPVSYLWGAYWIKRMHTSCFFNICFADPNESKSKLC